MLGVRRSDLPLDKDAHSRFLPWLIAFMVFLAALAMMGMVVFEKVAAKWDAGLTGTLTIQRDGQELFRADIKDITSLVAATPALRFTELANLMVT